MNIKSNNSVGHRILFATFVLVSVSLTSIRCQKWVRPQNDPQISTHNDDESHYNGHNCMNCHYSEGRGEGWFLVGGTAEGNYQNSNVYLYEDFNSPSIATVKVDTKGNFYTTEDIDFSKGLFVSVQKPGAPEEQMESKIFNGQCNLCHGVTTSAISL